MAKSQKSDVPKMSSVFTRIINREEPARIVWEDGEFIAIIPKSQFVNIGHLLVVPKIEVDYIFDLAPEVYRTLWEHVRRLSVTLKKITSARRIGIAVEGFSVPHVHVHLCPVNEVAELDPHRDVEWTEDARDRFVAKFREAHESEV